MIYRIADLFVELPETDKMNTRCKDYLSDHTGPCDVVVKQEHYRPERWDTDDEEMVEYMESGWLFYRALLKFDGMMLHSSAVLLDGKVYLFSGPSGMGKSTHTRLWQDNFPGVQIINDDKPALRKIDGVWYAYGTPWCGKDGININTKAPVGGICFLRKGEKNKIRRLSPIESVAAILTQTQKRYYNPAILGAVADRINDLVYEIPVFELTNRPEREAALMSYNALVGENREA